MISITYSFLNYLPPKKILKKGGGRLVLAFKPFFADPSMFLIEPKCNDATINHDFKALFHKICPTLIPRNPDNQKKFNIKKHPKKMLQTLRLLQNFQSSKHLSILMFQITVHLHREGVIYSTWMISYPEG